MKKIIYFTVLYMICFISYAYSFNIDNNVAAGSIENGWYTATVKYFNSSTYTRSTYTLNVRVENDRVTAIDFGNGGSVHSGYNNSGYFYSGGYLYFETDINSNIVAATTKVTVTKNGSSVSYSIRID